jgi:ABC-type dipeptide/oligopeptide/nickel transport system permease subunit
LGQPALILADFDDFMMRLTDAFLAFPVTGVVCIQQLISLLFAMLVFEHLLEGGRCSRNDDHTIGS